MSGLPMWQSLQCEPLLTSWAEVFAHSADLAA
jgi:hypothetical protein